MSADAVTFALLGAGGYAAYKAGLLDELFGPQGQLPPGESRENSAIARLKDKSLANAYAKGGFKDSALRLSSAPRVTEKPNNAGTTQLPTTTEKKPDKAETELGAAAKQKLKEEYDKLECGAKKAGAAKLNEQFGTTVVDPNKACDQTFEQVFAAVAAAGAIAGCAAVGLGAAVAPLCGMVGAYLGKEIGAWVKEELMPWLEDVWDGISDEVGSWFEDVI